MQCDFLVFFFFSSRRRHTRSLCDWSSDVCSSDLPDRPPQAQEPLPGGTERLLFVDDEPAIAALGLEVLTRLGYQVVVCRSSQEALDTFRATSPPFDLVIRSEERRVGKECGVRVVR